MKETKILYRGISLTGSFSPETLEWLNIYNSLPKELQDTVNFEPWELTEALHKSNMLTINTSATVYDVGQYDPAGGLVFNPEFWNDKDAIELANCYAHAMNVNVQTPRARLQPGEIGQVPVDIRQPILQVANNLIRAVEQDISTGMGRIVKLRSCTDDDIPQGEEYKVAFVVAPEASNANRIFDYHWYRENKNGVWSHKPGLTDATTEDNSKKTINADNKPEQCDRNYNRNLNYSIFCGYYMVTYSRR